MGGTVGIEDSLGLGQTRVGDMVNEYLVVVHRLGDALQFALESKEECKGRALLPGLGDPRLNPNARAGPGANAGAARGVGSSNAVLDWRSRGTSRRAQQNAGGYHLTPTWRADTPLPLACTYRVQPWLPQIDRIHV